MADVALQSWEYLELLPGTDFYRLYKNPTSALAIFRKRLSSLAKSFVMFTLYMRTPMVVSDLDLMTNPSSLKEKEHALDLLHRYHIFSDTHVNTARAFQLTENFARSLRQALEGSGSIESFGEVSTAPVRSIKIEDLDRFAREQWEGILGYMVGSSAILLDDGEAAIAEPSRGVMHLLQEGHLIELSGTASRGYKPKITKEGFAFVLQDVNTQVWALLFLYVDLAEEAKGTSKVDVLSFLFLVSSMELGLAYSSHNLTQAQQSMLPDLQDFGIVYCPPGKEIFYPTRLATTLTADSVTALSHTATTLGSSLAPSHTRSISTTSSSAGSTLGFIILETNFRLYAYTSSPLQIALLALFTNLRSRHPNLVTAKISKQSVKRAVNAGITADQIIAYLSTHAHPQMRRAKNANPATSSTLNPDAPPPPPQTTTTSVLPATVIDQIHLWQLERDRMTTTPGFLLKDFQTEAEYETTRKYADEIGVLVWQHDRKRMFFVSRIEGVRSFMAERKERAGGAAG